MALAKVYMLVTLIGTTSPTIDHIPVESMTTCRDQIVKYVNDFPGAEVKNKTANSIQAVRGQSAGQFGVIIYVRCQEGEK